MTKVSTVNMPAEIVVDENLVLRYIRPDDARELFKIIEEDPEIKHNVSWPARTHTLADARRNIEQLLRDPRAPYVLQEKGVIIGFVGTWDSERSQKEVGFSYFLAKSSRGHGYSIKAVQSLMQATQASRPVDTFLVNIADTNEASKAVAKHLGFKPTGVLITDGDLQVPTRRYERHIHD